MNTLKQLLLIIISVTFFSRANGQLISYSQEGFLTKVQPETNKYRNYKTYDYLYFFVKDVNGPANKALNTYGPEISSQYLAYNPEAPDFKFVTAVYNAGIDEIRKYDIIKDSARCFIALDYLFTAFDRSGNKVTSYKVIDTLLVKYPAKNTSFVRDNILLICSKAIQQSQQNTWDFYFKKWFGYNDYNSAYAFITTFVNKDDFKENNYAVKEIEKAASQDYDVQNKALEEQRKEFISIADKATGKSAAEVKSISLFNVSLTYLVMGDNTNADDYYNKAIAAGEYEGKIKYAYKIGKKTFAKRQAMMNRKPIDQADASTDHNLIESVKNSAAFFIINGKMVTDQKTPKEYSGEIKIAYYKLYQEKNGNILNLDKSGKTNTDPITIGDKTFKFSEVAYIMDNDGKKYEVKSDFMESTMWKPEASNDKFTIYSNVYPTVGGSMAFKKAGDPKLYVVNFMNKKSIYSKIFPDCPDLVENLMEQIVTTPQEILDFYQKNCGK